MKLELVFALSVAALALLPSGSASAQAQSGASGAKAPPVDVEVLEEEDSDFFSEPSGEEEDLEVEAGVQKDADAAFDALEAEEGKRARAKRVKKKKSSDGANENVSQQVVNVVVVGGNKDSATEAHAGLTGAPVAVTAPGAPNAPSSPLVPAISGAQGATSLAATRPGQRETWTTWWERPRGIAAGDLIVGYSIGGFEGGVFNGLSLEGLASDLLGIELAIKAGGLTGHEGRGSTRGDLDFFLGGRAVVPLAQDRRTINDAFLHMESLALTFHLGDGSGIELVPSIGVSHFGYHIDYGARDQDGGSGFLSAGMKLGWLYRRFFIGADVGWHPIELFRYEGVERGQEDFELEKRTISDATDSRRFTASLMMGLSL